MTQRFATLHQLGVQPGSLASDLRLSEGKWCLSSLSNVPYVTLTGLGYTKEFSWGEMIEIPRGATGQIINSSRHKGDVYINAGWDYANTPRRVTVPVHLKTIINPPAQDPYPETGGIASGTLVTTEYPVDTRRALKAYLVISPVQSQTDITFYVFGSPNTTSFDTANFAPNIALPMSPQIGYVAFYTLLANTYGVKIPLGADAGINPNDPHALLDYSQVFFAPTSLGGEPPFTGVFPMAMHVLEY